MENYLEKVKNKRSSKQEDDHKKAMLAAFVGLSDSIHELLESLEKTGTKKLDSEFISAVKSLTEISKKIDSVKVTSDRDIKNGIRLMVDAISRIDTKPVVNVAAPKVEVKERELNLKPLLDALKKLDSKPVVNVDISGVEDAVKKVESAVKNQQFPVSNYILPFRNEEGAATQINAIESSTNPGIYGIPALNPDGSNISGGGGGGGDVNIAEVGGNPTDVSSGNLSTGTQRVAIATNDVNMSAMNASLAVIDDWDESDRAKVNPIVGQAGVAAGAGSVGSTTQRVVHAGSTTGTVTSVNDTNVSTTLLSANTSRIGATIFNDSTAVLYVKFGTTASTTSFTVKLQPDDYYEVPAYYNGRIDGIWASDASGAARITEIT